MRILRNWFIILAMISLVIADVLALPNFLERLYSANNYNPTNVRPAQVLSQQPPRRRTTKSGRSYKDICRVVNPAPHAFPGKFPYPAVPIC